MSTSVWMKRCVFAGGVLLLAIAGITPAGAAAASAKSALSTRLDVERGSVGTHDDVVLRYTLRNDSTADMLVVYWQTPVRGVMNDLFDVRRDGQPVTYVGREYKWATPQAKDFVRVPAGGELSASVELSAVYDISRSGEYTIGYRLRPNEDPILLGNAAAVAATRAENLRSNTVALSIERDAALEATRALPGDLDEQASRIDPTYVTPGYVSCSSSRQSTLQSATGAAETMSSKAKNYLAAGTVDSGYTTWFGTYSSTNYNTAKTHFNSIYSVFNTKKVTYYCDCTDSAYAYVYANQPYNVHLCNAFWSAPLTGIDSKGGTLVHEVSHFTVVAATDDWAYGTAGCQRLSTKKKLDNADCHEYFAETK